MYEDSLQLVLYKHKKPDHNAIHIVDCRKAQKLGLTLCQIKCWAVIHFGDVSLECLAQVVSTESTQLHFRPDYFQSTEIIPTK